MKLKEGLIYRNEDAILFDTENGKLIELNESANKIVATIIEGCDDKGDICIKLKSEYPDSSIEDISKLVDDFLREIIHMGYVV